MSGTPKYCQAELDRQRRERLERERRRQGEEEARRRREAEDRERRRRLEELRAALIAEVGSTRDRISSRSDALYAADVNVLGQRCDKLVVAIRGEQSEKRLRSQEPEIRAIFADLSEAMARKRREDAERKRLAELERLAFQISEVDHGISEIPRADALKFDPNGSNSTREAIIQARAAIAKGDPAVAGRSVRNVEEVFKKHSKEVSRGRDEWIARRSEAVLAAQELQAHIEGLRADPMLMRWHHKAVSEFASSLVNANQAITAEEFAAPKDLLSRAKARSIQLLEEASQAQLKADQRDYIVASIAQTLKAMNFVVSPASQEHPGHPATAMVLEAATGSNKSVYVSIPFEGKIMYTVDGYPLTTETAVGGGRAATCDQAERVLTEMQQHVLEAFGVKMGEIMWEGKDPNRNLRKADELPSGTVHQARGLK